MRENQALTDWDKLAETGWQEMHKMLLQHAHAIDTPLITVLEKRNYFIIISIFLITILLNIFPAYLYDSSVIPFRQVSKGFVMQAPLSPIHPAIINNTNHKKVITAIVSDNKSSTYTIAASSVLLSLKKIISPVVLSNTNKVTSLNDTCNTHQITADSNNKSGQPNLNSSLTVKKRPFLKRLQIFGGAGLNLPTQTTNSGSLTWSDINIHPSVTVIIPLNSKFSLHSGIHAMSTIHQKGVAIKNEERVSALGSNYNINTTSIIKVSYFDVPLALHYSINHQWTIGGGIQLSKFYKLNIREEKKSYDFNNRIISATAQQYFVNAGQIGVPSLTGTVNIKRFEARLMAEVSLHQSRWLFSAGYYYGTEKNIEIKETSGQYHQYRNEYLRLGVEYQLYKR